jgi:hypothetical protein
MKLMSFCCRDHKIIQFDGKNEVQMKIEGDKDPNMSGVGIIYLKRLVLACGKTEVFLCFIKEFLSN